MKSWQIIRKNFSWNPMMMPPEFQLNLCLGWLVFTLMYVCMYANLVILATPERIIGLQVVCLGHLGGFVAF